jgi:hypothetical protein
VLERLGLVRVELLDAARRERSAQPIVGVVGKRREGGGNRRQPVRRGHDRIGVPPERRARGGQAAERVLKGAILIAADDRKSLGSHGNTGAAP